MRSNALPKTGVFARVRLKSANGSVPARLSQAMFCLGVLVVSGRAAAAEYYVSPTGSDSNAGTTAAPFATLSKANSAAQAGDTIWVHGGTYYLTTQLVLSKSGTSDANRTKIWAVAGETPILDASKYVTSNAAKDVPVVLVQGSWMHLRGLEIANAKVGANGDHSYSLLRTDGTSNASHNTFELLNLHHGFGPGLFIDTGTGGNLILNCDSHDNYDKNGSQGDGQNGDGFGVHYQTSGPSTIIHGCRAWNNSDDGYDLISQEVPVTVENSWAMSNGHGSSGNGNGFKMGSSKTGIRHIVRNNVAWKNAASGFYANHSTGGNTWYNNTSYMNGTQYNMLASSFDSDGNVTGTIILTGSKAHIMRNNIGFPNKNSDMGGVDTASNSWDLNITEASTDFASTSDAGCTGPREADGGMPAACTFLKLKAGSPLIDKGTNVMLPYVGAAPDLGAYEYGAATPDGGVATTTGGATGTMTTGTTGRDTTTSSTGTATTGGLGSTGNSVGTSSSAGPTTGSTAGASTDTTGATAGDTSTGNTTSSVNTTSGGSATASGTTDTGGASATGTTATTPTSGGVTATSGGGTPSNATTSGEVAPNTGESGGCGCRTVNGSRNLGNGSLILSLLGLAAGVRRRRKTRSPIVAPNSLPHPH